jgi:hypothetical protein
VPGQEYFDEAFDWFKAIYENCKPFEYPLLRAYIFSFHCMHLCSRMDVLVKTGNDQMLLSSLPSIWQDVDKVESATLPFLCQAPGPDWEIKPPLVPYEYVSLPYIGIYVLQSNYRLRVSYYILNLLYNASKTSGCTPEQQAQFVGFRDRYSEEIIILKQRISDFLSLISGTRFHALEVMAASIFLYQPAT